MSKRSFKYTTMLKSILLRIFFSLILGVLIHYSVQSQSRFHDLDKVIESKKRILGGDVCVLVSNGNTILYEKNLGEYNPNTVKPIASCSKWLTAALVMTFVDEGKLSLDDKVSKYIPAFNTKDKNEITIQHCLSHQTGIESKRITLFKLMKRRKYKSLQEEVLNDFALRSMIGEPGKVFAYGNVGLNIAGYILELISGSDFETLMQEKILKPLQMKSTTFVSKGAVNPSGSARSSASDYIRFLNMLINKGVYNGEQILSEKSIQQMCKSYNGGVSILFTPEQGEGVDYGLGCWVLQKDIQQNGQVVCSPGLFGTYPYINLKRHYTAIIFVKNLKIKNRKQTYGELMNRIDEVVVKTN